MTFHRFAALVLLAAGCAQPRTSPPAGDCQSQGNTEASAVDVVSRRCATCHDASSESPLTTRAALLARRMTIHDRVTASVMPPAGAPSLSAADREALLSWAACR